MKYILTSLIMFLLMSSVEAQTFYLLRHAEKAADGTKDPVLTEVGQVRAENIAAMLSSAEIQYVFSTDYQRTQLTAKPMAELLGVSVISYDPRKLEDFVETLKQLKGNAMVVGHSNTTPQLATLLSGQEVKPLSESDFGDIYQVTVLNGTAVVNMLKSLPLSKAPADQSVTHQ